ncbi:AraC family transcriptional regulator [Bradyrhizobium frederickii]|uniref:AraC family transcriptional regulator n=1 Tax=Bradyrhizobium frederickii TaxID=2560054 RepID=A0A4Y9P6J1_9BRAD|nr:AraC family transcriptional regulator [Bradyrhizobium frederickii]TFV75824.1 AraC family transcriptional regulator [Bradyrhizobium frederickii]
MTMLDEQISDSLPLHWRACDGHIAPPALVLPNGGAAEDGSSRAPKVRACGGLPPRTVRRICEFVDGHIEQRISIKTLAGIANLSVCYFVRAFKRTMGTTPHEYLMRQRVELAMRLLSGSDMGLSEIALAAGFVDQSHCARRFRQRVGMSPRDYRCLTS